jgi:hypothetical protein
VRTNVDDLEADAITAPPIETSKLVDGQPAVGPYRKEFLRLLVDISWENGFASSRTPRR